MELYEFVRNNEQIANAKTKITESLKCKWNEINNHHKLVNENTGFKNLRGMFLNVNSKEMKNIFKNH